MAAIHWINSAGGDFSDGADWSGGTVPGAGDSAVIDASGAYTVTLSSAETVGSLILDDAGATLSFGDGADLTLGSSLTLKSGSLILSFGATISGGSLRAKKGNFLWFGGTLDGVTYDGPLNMTPGSVLVIGPDGLILTGRDGTGPGKINLSGKSFLEFDSTQTLDNATINLNGSAILGPFGGGVLTLGESLTISHTGGLSVLDGSGIVNEGVIEANLTTSTDHLTVGSTATQFTNLGTMIVSNGDSLIVTPRGGGFVNLEEGTLTGGVYEVDASSTLELGIDETVVTDDAVITLNGAGSVFQSRDGTSQKVPIEATLTTIGATGTLRLLAGRDWTSTNAITNAGTLILGGGTFAPSALANSGLVSGQGVIGVGIANSGIIEAATGTLDLAQAITGSGTMKIDAGATLKVDGAAASTLTARFFEGAGTLDLAAPSGFAATLHGFAPTDTIDLLNTAATAATLGAGDTLVITDNGNAVATLQLGGTYTGDAFNVVSDGQGGTNITVTLPGAALDQPAPSHQFIAAMAGLGGHAGGSVSLMGAVHAEDRRLALSVPRMQFA